MSALTAIFDPPWATNRVACRGDALSPVIWLGEQWAVTTHGVECRDGCYVIEASRVNEGHAKGHSWEKHMAEKSWVDIVDFGVAMRIARIVFEKRAGG